MRSCYRSQRRFCSKKEEDIFVIENRKGGNVEVCEESVEQEIYPTIEITTNVTGVLYAEE